MFVLNPLLDFRHLFTSFLFFNAVLGLLARTLAGRVEALTQSSKSSAIFPENVSPFSRFRRRSVFSMSLGGSVMDLRKWVGGLVLALLGLFEFLLDADDVFARVFERILTCSNFAHHEGRAGANPQRPVAPWVWQGRDVISAGAVWVFAFYGDGVHAVLVRLGQSDFHSVPFSFWFY